LPGPRLRDFPLDDLEISARLRDLRRLHLRHRRPLRFAAVLYQDVLLVLGRPRSGSRCGGIRILARWRKPL